MMMKAITPGKLLKPGLGNHEAHGNLKSGKSGLGLSTKFDGLLASLGQSKPGTKNTLTALHGLGNQGSLAGTILGKKLPKSGEVSETPVLKLSAFLQPEHGATPQDDGEPGIELAEQLSLPGALGIALTKPTTPALKSAKTRVTNKQEPVEGTIKKTVVAGRLRKGLSAKPARPELGAGSNKLDVREQTLASGSDISPGKAARLVGPELSKAKTDRKKVATLTTENPEKHSAFSAKINFLAAKDGVGAEEGTSVATEKTGSAAKSGDVVRNKLSIKSYGAHADAGASAKQSDERELLSEKPTLHRTVPHAAKSVAAENSVADLSPAESDKTDNPDIVKKSARQVVRHSGDNISTDFQGRKIKAQAKSATAKVVADDKPSQPIVQESSHDDIPQVLKNGRTKTQIRPRVAEQAKSGSPGTSALAAKTATAKASQMPAPVTEHAESPADFEITSGPGVISAKTEGAQAGSEIRMAHDKKASATTEGQRRPEHLRKLLSLAEATDAEAKLTVKSDGAKQDAPNRPNPVAKEPQMQRGVVPEKPQAQADGAGKIVETPKAQTIDVSSVHENGQKVPEPVNEPPGRAQVKHSEPATSSPESAKHKTETREITLPEIQTDKPAQSDVRPKHAAVHEQQGGAGRERGDSDRRGKPQTSQSYSISQAGASEEMPLKAKTIEENPAKRHDSGSLRQISDALAAQVRPTFEEVGGKLVGTQPVEASRLTELLQKITEVTQNQLHFSGSKVAFQMDVKEMGKILVDAHKHLDKINLQVHVETHELRKLIEAHLRPLIDQLIKDGVDIGKLDVSVRDQRPEQQPQQNFSDRNDGRRQSQTQDDSPAWGRRHNQNNLHSPKTASVAGPRVQNAATAMEVWA